MITFVTLFFIFSFVLSVILCGMYEMRGAINRFRSSVSNGGKDAAVENGAKFSGQQLSVQSVRNIEMRSSNALGGTRSQMLMGSASNLLQ
ncbi:hypothetical protein BKA69DRAFT_1100736 [Paraphysoderma sedebokerense]|nr:hypothetical protein BKA69DRAFT_1100736 [Paraphysoderma sedebokerense]